MSKENSSKSRKFIWLAIIIIMFALAFYFFSGKGTSLLGGQNDSGDASQSVVMSDQSEFEIVIEVKQSSIYWEGEELSLEELSERLNQLADQTRIKLIDNNAILSTMEDVQDQLKETNLQVETKQASE
ncbi:hypothetical protein [Hutsoniella sourekii]|uniref:hypothetical protein n=1 Tax=Hutsoniella sourekii TaxID=87650 RepID=UPI0004886760|nr:hypothetical protein [Hutsoniella sourekii]